MRKINKMAGAMKGQAAFDLDLLEYKLLLLQEQMIKVKEAVKTLKEFPTTEPELEVPAMALTEELLTLDDRVTETFTALWGSLSPMVVGYQDAEYDKRGGERKTYSDWICILRPDLRKQIYP